LLSTQVGHPQGCWPSTEQHNEATAFYTGNSAERFTTVRKLIAASAGAANEEVVGKELTV
jgi:hypothetical protein